MNQKTIKSMPNRYTDSYNEIKVADIQSRLSVAWQRTLFRLWIAKFRNEKYYLSHNPDNVISGGFLPIYAVTGSLIGGSSGGRRLRSLRNDYGIPFITSIVNGHIKNYRVHEWELYGEKKRTPIYCLACELTFEDWEEIIEKGARYYYIPRRQNPSRNEISITTGKDNQLCFI